MLYPNLNAEMARYGIKRKDIADRIYNGRVATVSERLNGKFPMDIDEAVSIRDEFFPNLTIDYLFDKNARGIYEKEGVN